MQKLIILKGLPASGKTTFARKWINEYPKNRVRVNRDDIRRMLGPYWLPEREDLVTYIETKSVSEALWKGYSVVVDATNFRINSEKQVRQRFCETMDVSKVDIEIKFLDTPLNECLTRDRKRKYSVGDDVIIEMYNKYLKG